MPYVRHQKTQYSVLNGQTSLPVEMVEYGRIDVESAAPNDHPIGTNLPDHFILVVI